jgi:hypothetical protein
MELFYLNFGVSSIIIATRIKYKGSNPVPFFDHNLVDTLHKTFSYIFRIMQFSTKLQISKQIKSFNKNLTCQRLLITILLDPLQYHQMNL